MSSKFPFGYAVRKYGKENFVYEFEIFSCVEDALCREAELVTDVEVSSKKYYNVSVGGALSNVLINKNPMHNEEVVANHPNVWSSTNNPMHNAESKQRMIDGQRKRPVRIDNILYASVSYAAKLLNLSKQLIRYRASAHTFPTWQYV